MTRGAFITVEGIEGVGKSSCLAVIERTVAAAGHTVRVTREPGGTALGESVRDWILHGGGDRPDALTETLLMFAARRHHLEHVIEPALSAGLWVVCDRFTDATYAYQGAGRGVAAELIAVLADAVHADRQPDLTLLLDAPVDVGLGRIRDREHDHFERERAGFFERVRAAYLERHGAEPGRIRLIDASGSLEAVATEVESSVEAFLARFRAP